MTEKLALSYLIFGTPQLGAPAKGVDHERLQDWSVYGIPDWWYVNLESGGVFSVIAATHLTHPTFRIQVRLPKQPMQIQPVRDLACLT
jgi:hypothetical protein